MPVNIEYAELDEPSSSIQAFNIRQFYLFMGKTEHGLSILITV